MRIEHIQVKAHGVLKDLDLGPVGNTLSVIQTASEGNVNKAVELQKLLFNLITEQEHYLGSHTNTLASVTLTDQDHTYHQHLECNTTQTKRWHTNPASEKPIRDQQNDSKSIWMEICRHSDTLICGTRSDSLSPIIESYRSIWRVIDHSDQTTLGTIRVGIGQTQTESSLTKGKRWLLHARLAEVEQETSELLGQQTNLPALLARRNHLAKRLTEPSPCMKIMSETRSLEISKQIQEYQEQHALICAQNEKSRQQIANIELDLAHCRPAPDASSMRQHAGQLSDYQQLCDTRNHMLHELEKSERRRVEIERNLLHISRRQDQQNYAHQNRLGMHPEELEERRSIESEIRRINQQIQCNERLAWLEERKTNYLEQIAQVNNEESSKDHLMQAAQNWFRSLSENQEAKLTWTSTEKTSQQSSRADTPRYVVTINGQWEKNATQSERQLSHLALRLAAAEHLQNKSIQFPLIVALCREDAWVCQGVFRTIATYSNQDRQLIILTDNAKTAQAIQSEGAQCLRAETDEAEKTADSNRETKAQASTTNATQKDPDTSAIAPSHDEPATDKHTSDLQSASCVSQIPGISKKVSDLLNEKQIATIEDLLIIDDGELLEIADQDTDVHATLRRVKSICDLLCKVSNLGFFDATILIGAGIHSADDLSHCEPAQLLIRTEQFLLTPEGQSALNKGTAPEISRLLTWLAAAHLKSCQDTDQTAHSMESKIESARLSVSPSTNSRSGRSQSQDEPVAITKQISGATNANSGLTETNETTSDSSSSGDDTSSLDQDTELVKCAFLDSQSAQRLSDLGHARIGQFLSADPRTLSDELGSPKLNPKDIHAWQKQINLALHIPTLTPPESRLLVIAGVDSPQALSAASSIGLREQLERFANSSRGKRKLRSIKIPSTEVISEWIASCKPTSQQQAA